MEMISLFIWKIQKLLILDEVVHLEWKANLSSHNHFLEHAIKTNGNSEIALKRSVSIDV